MDTTDDKLNLPEIVALLASKAEISGKEADDFIKEMFAVISETLSEDGMVKVKDFGTFKLSSVQARESVDVNTGEKIEIPAHQRLNFIPATALKELVNKPFSHFETVLLNEGVAFEDMPCIEEDDDTDTDFLEESELLLVEKSNNVDIPSDLSTESVVVPKIVVEKSSNPIGPPQRIVVSRKETLSKKRKSTRRNRKSNALAIMTLGGIAVAITVVAFFFQSRNNKE